MRKTIYDLNPDYMLDLNQEYMLKHEIFLEDKNPIRYIADHYGYEAQSRQLIEEMAELTQAINKMWRIDATKCEKTNSGHVEAYKHIIEEIADVEICLEQVKWLLNVDESVLEEWKVMKIERSIARMSGKEPEIEVGDEVKVTHNSCCYTRYEDWVTDNVSDVCDRLRYDYANLPSNGDIGIVKKKGLHCSNGKMLYYIIELNTGRCYLISEDGIKLHRKRVKE